MLNESSSIGGVCSDLRGIFLWSVNLDPNERLEKSKVVFGETLLLEQTAEHPDCGFVSELGNELPSFYCDFRVFERVVGQKSLLTHLLNGLFDLEELAEAHELQLESNVALSVNVDLLGLLLLIEFLLQSVFRVSFLYLAEHFEVFLGLLFLPKVESHLDFLCFSGVLIVHGLGIQLHFQVLLFGADFFVHFQTKARGAREDFLEGNLNLPRMDGEFVVLL